MPAPPIDVHYRVDGQPGAPGLVLSHAMGLSLVMWEPQMPRLSHDFRVARYDHRGHGRSSVPPGPYQMRDLGRDLLTLLDRLELDRVSFCGISLGGMVGLWLAAHEPARLDRLVICCAAPRMLHPEDYAARASQVRRDGVASVADAVLARWFTPAFIGSQPDAVDSVRRLLVSTSAEGYAATCEALAQMDQLEDLRRIVAPTLVIAAEHDQSTPPEQSREMAERIPGARFVLIAAASHLANIEQAEAVTDQIVQHLVRNSPSS
jgi:3-oxoadipate enol-lactonase